MKYLAFVLFIIHSTTCFATTNLRDSIELYKTILPGIYTGDNCELRVHTEWYGEYDKRFLFYKDGKVIDVETFYVETIVRNLTYQNENKALFFMKDEIGSDGEDKFINFKMDFELVHGGLEITSLNYRYYSNTFLGIPTGSGRLVCNNMVRTGDAEDITLDTTYDYY
jgi:hypothetical protein